ncbi:GNAT family N-acetyltransferase [bacterium]|nr:GNAT family N-acetyltransferase [bacterium]
MIKRATIDDLESILDVFNRSIKSTCKNDYNNAQIEAWCKSGDNKERWAQLIEIQYFIVSESKGIITGFASLDGIDYLDFMYVHPDYQRTGIAKSLFSNCKNEAQNRGAQRLISDVSITAKPFFESLGFQIIRSNRNLRFGETLINFRMELKIFEH